MLTNYLKLSVRLLVRNPYFTFINVFGLSIGFTVFFGLWEFTSSELKSDQFHNDYERIARLYVDWQWTDDGKNWGKMKISKTPSSFANDLDRDFPEVESFLRIYHQENFVEDHTGSGNQLLLGRDDGGKLSVFRERHMIYADKNLFEFFNIPLLVGDKQTVLNDQNAIVLSASNATKIFGPENPLGKMLVLNNSTPLVVTGVFEDLPTNTHLDFECVVSNTARKLSWDATQGSFVSTYVKLDDKSFEALESKFNSRIKTYWNEMFALFPHVSAKIVVQPLKDIVFESQSFANQYFSVKSRATLEIFRAVSVIILLMAWINCLNLTITRMSRRTKEIAARKMTGAQSRDFIKQFMIEAIILNSLAVLMAATFLQLLRSPAHTLLEIDLAEFRKISTDTKLIFLSVMCTGILITGFYPAFISFKRTPTVLFKMSFKGRTGNVVPSIFTTLQYTAAVILVFCGIIIHRQLNFVLTKELGWDKSNVLTIEPPIIRTSSFTNDLYTFKAQLDQKKYIAVATLTSNAYDLKLQRSGTNFVVADAFAVQENYIPFFKLKLLVGRNFQPDEPGEGIIVTRIATQRLGFASPADALGEKIMMAPRIDLPMKDTHIIGVIEDFRVKPFFQTENNSESQTGRGYAFQYLSRTEGALPPETLFLRIGGESITTALSDIEDLFKQTFPGNVFSASFVEEQINSSYAREKTTRNQITFFTCLAIGIACLGLLAMISNTIEEKTKEIGIRKVLGAGISNVAQVLVGSTVVQLLVAMVLGIPLAWYLAVSYLERYSERIQIEWWYSTLPAVILVCILFITISALLWKATRTNPADTLRYE